MSKIIVKYLSTKCTAVVTGDFEVMLLGDDNEELIDVKLDQCRQCGVWCSEDDELYGDGYCTRCAEMCSGCQMYFNGKDLTIVDDEPVCKRCLLG